jgi:hypothetical protein
MWLMHCDQHMGLVQRCLSLEQDCLLALVNSEEAEGDSVVVDGLPYCEK